VRIFGTLIKQNLKLTDFFPSIHQNPSKDPERTVAQISATTGVLRDHRSS